MLKKILITLTLLFCYVEASVVTTTNTKEMEGVGIGQTRQEAVNNAIIEALGQLEGVRIKKKNFIDNQTINATSGNDAKYVHSQKIQNLTSGKVDSYQILNVFEKPNGEYEATVNITKTTTTKQYKTPGLDPKGRRSMAVVPVYTTEGSFEVFGREESAGNIASKLTQELVSELTKTRKFTMLDREFDEAYNEEKALLKSGDAQRDELYKLGNVLGVDYLLTSNISEFGVVQSTETVRITGQTTSSTRAFVTLQYRIIAMATRQVKWANTLSLEFEPMGTTFEQVYLDVLGIVSEKLTQEVIENIYPIKIADTSGTKEVIIGQNVPVGTRYEVFALGKKLYDPYTKEYLGQDEVFSGEIEVVRALPKISYARIISGEAKKGSICRKPSSGGGDEYYDNTPQKPSDVQLHQGGGVKLPFD